MKLISLNEWCAISEAKKSPVEDPAEAVPQELKILCISPDPANRKLAAYQLINYDRKDNFFKENLSFLKKFNNEQSKFDAIDLNAWVSAGKYPESAIKSLETMLDHFCILDGKIYIFKPENLKYTTKIYDGTSRAEIFVVVVGRNGKFTHEIAYVEGDIDFRNTELKSLKGMPAQVPGNLNCSRNKLTSLEGCPQTVGGDFNCSQNELKSLQGGPGEVGGDYICNHNWKLTTLKGSPSEIKGLFKCSHTGIKSLAGAPTHVDGSFYCNNNGISSFAGGPKYVGGDYVCFGTDIVNLEGLAEEIGGNFEQGFSYKNFSEDEIRKVSNIKGTIN